MHLRLTLIGGRQHEHVEVVGHGVLRWHQLLSHLPAHWSQGPTWWVEAPLGGGTVPVGPDSVVGAAPLLHGTVVRAGERPAGPAGRAGPVLVRVSEGPDCGLVLPLLPGRRLVAGRGVLCDLRIRDPGLSRHHLTITSTRGGVIVEDAGSTNGSLLNGSPLKHPTPWTPGSRLAIGSTRLELGTDSHEPLVARADGPGRLTLAPHRLPPPALEKVEVSRPHQAPPARPPGIPVLAWTLPLVVSAVLALVLRMPMLLLFGLMAPALTLGNFLSDRRRHHRETRDSSAAHAAAVATSEAMAQRALAAELGRRRARTPDLATLHGQVARGPTTPVWSVPALDTAGTRVRVGTGTQPSLVHVDGVQLDLEDAPLEIDLAGGVAIVGAPELVRAAGRALLCQLLVRHAAHDLTLSVAAHDQEWEWLTWAPHAAVTSRTRGRLHVALQDLWSWRAGATGAGPPARPPVPTDQETVVLLAPDRSAGSGMATVVEIVSPHRMQVSRSAYRTVTTGRPDLLGHAVADSVARALAPYSSSHGREGVSPVPPSVHFGQLHPGDLTARGIAGRWRASPRSTVLALGVGAEGTCTVDLALDGPHALVAGTTGSGKSELLRTLVTSLALANRPDELSLVLVDYKGGAAFSDAARLPHTLGVITDLDPHLADRALTSLTAELKRRERLLAQAGARDLDEYQQVGGAPGLPRLVLVIDEFRALAEELPAFVQGLVRIAALGRSLGVHLVLATQRPGGIVSADVRANVNLRIALRLRDASDSHDVIDCADAASLPERLPGRALIRTGATAPRMVQVARVTEPLTAGPHDATVTVRTLPSLWSPPVSIDTPGLDSAPGGPSLLHRLSSAAREAATMLAITPPPSPWLPPLPDVVRVAELRSDGPGAAQPAGVPLILLDLPARQEQRPVWWDPLADGHLALVGAPRSGRSTAARTAVAGLVERRPPTRVHLYGFDLAGAMRPVAELPHTGAWVGAEEVARGTRVLDGLAELLAARRRILAAAGVTSVSEQQDGALPLLCLVVDGWPQFVEAYGELERGRLLEVTHQLLRDGPAMGLVALLTGDRSLLTTRVSSLLPRTWCLRMTDPADLLMTGLRRNQVPARMPAGRVLRLSDGAVGQVAVTGDGTDGASQVKALGALAERLGRDHAAASPAGLPWAVRALPRRVHLASLPRSSRPGLVIGVGGDSAEPVHLPIHPSRGGTALVSGPAGSGRTTTLRTMAASARAQGWSVLLVDPDDEHEHIAGELQRLADDAGRRMVLVDDVARLADTPLEDRLLAWAGTRSAHGGTLVVAGDPQHLAVRYRGLVPLATSSRTGILLQPSGPADGTVLGVAPPGGEARVPGRGVIVDHGRLTRLQVAVPDDG